MSEGGSPGRRSTAVPVATPYDPYAFRTDGTLGYVELISPFNNYIDFMAFIHLVKCSFGTGVLAFPYGFKNAGVVGGFIIGVVVSVFVIWCMHILIKCMMRIAAEQQTPYVEFSDAVKYSFTRIGGKVVKVGKYSPYFIDAVIALYHFGICTAYIMFLVKTTLTLLEYRESTTGSVNPIRTVTTFIWVLPLFCINCFRDMKYLFPLSLIGNITTLVSMLIIVVFIFYPTGSGWDSWELTPHQHVVTAPLFIGQVLFAVESFGVILNIEKSMAKPKHFGGYFGVYNVSMLVVVIWYLFIGCSGYMKYGQQILSEITLTIELAFADSEDPYLKGFPVALQFLMGAALYCSYPLQCFVVFDIWWTKYINPKLVEKQMIRSRKLAIEMSFRFLVTLASGIIGLLIPRLDLIISLVGCVCITILGLIMPATLELNLNNRKDEDVHRPKKKMFLTKGKGVALIAIGVLAFLIGSYCSIHSMATHSG